MGWVGFGTENPVPSPGGGSGDQRCACIQCFLPDFDLVAQSAGSSNFRELDGDDLIFKNLAWLRLDVLAMGSSFTVKWSLRKRL